MSDSGPISALGARLDDTALGAFVDGQIESAADRARIEELARTDPEVQARIAAYRTQKRAIRAAFDGTLTEPLPLHLLARRRPAAGARAWRAAAAVALFLAGAGAGVWLAPWSVPPPATVVAMNAPPAGALRSAAPEARKDAGALNESVATGTVPPEPTLADKPGAPASSAGGFLEQALLAYGLAAEPGKETAGTASSDDARAGRDAELDSLGLPGLSLDLAPLGFDLLARRDIAGGATAVAGVAFVFADRQGRRVMLFVSAAPAELPGPGFQWLQRGPLQVVAWSANSGGFALVGPLPRNALQALARAVAGQTFN